MSGDLAAPEPRGEGFPSGAEQIEATGAVTPGWFIVFAHEAAAERGVGARGGAICGPRDSFNARTVDICMTALLKVLTGRGQDALPDGGMLGLAGDAQDARSARLLEDAGFVLMRHGYRVANLGSVSSVMLAHWAATNRTGAFLINGGRIPRGSEGFQAVTPDGVTDQDTAIAALDQNVRLSRFMYDPAGDRQIACTLPPASSIARELYEERYRRFCAPRLLEGLQVGLLQQRGMMPEFQAALYRRLGAQVQPLAAGEFGDGSDLRALHEYVRAEAGKRRYDIVLGTNYDGDVPLVFDEFGERVPGDTLGFLTAGWLHVDTVAAPICCNSAIINAGFPRVYHDQVPVTIHLPHVAKWENTRAALAYNPDGGIFVCNDMQRNSRRLPSFHAADATLPHLAVMALRRETSKPLSELSRLACFTRVKLSAPVRPENDSPEDGTGEGVELSQDASSAQPPQAAALVDVVMYTTTRSGHVAFPRAEAQRILKHLARSGAGSNFAALNRVFKETFGEVRQTVPTEGLRMVFKGPLVIHLYCPSDREHLACAVEARAQERAERASLHELESSAQKRAESGLTQALHLIEGWKEKPPV